MKDWNKYNLCGGWPEYTDITIASDPPVVCISEWNDYMTSTLSSNKVPSLNKLEGKAVGYSCINNGMGIG